MSFRQQLLKIKLEKHGAYTSNSFGNISQNEPKTIKISSLGDLGEALWKPPWKNGVAKTSFFEICSPLVGAIWDLCWPFSGINCDMLFDMVSGPGLCSIWGHCSSHVGDFKKWRCVLTLGLIARCFWVPCFWTAFGVRFVDFGSLLGSLLGASVADFLEAFLRAMEITWDSSQNIRNSGRGGSKSYLSYKSYDHIFSIYLSSHRSIYWPVAAPPNHIIPQCVPQAKRQPRGGNITDVYVINGFIKEPVSRTPDLLCWVSGLLQAGLFHRSAAQDET